MPKPSRLVAALTLPLVLGACFERTTPSLEHAVQPVLAVRVAVRPATESRAVTGTIRPRREAEIGFRAGGRMASRDVDLGARVVAGQVLARLDPADLTLAVRSAGADLAGAEAQAAQARADAARSTILHAQGWTAAAADEAKQAVDRSAAERVAAARAALELARNRLGYGTLRAPADGVVTAVLADPGTVVAEGHPVLRLAEAGPMEAEVALPEATAAQAAGATATVTVWARPELVMAARLREIAAEADPKLRTYTARFAIAAPPPWLAYGMTATVRLGRDGGEALAAIPLSALADQDGRAMVWVIGPDGGTPEARPVELRRLGADRALVTGLREGELVIGLGVQKLDPATRVRVADIRPAVE